MEKQLEAEFILKKRFCAISIAKTSDLESKFNVKVASDLSKCDPNRKKYERTFLPSDTTCRRIMQRVYNEAQNIGFASFPSEQKGNVWCWGDEDGNFKNGVNRYIYETYYKLHSTIPLCKLPPWESVPALRLECIKRCQDQNDHDCVKKMSSEAKLQRWLLTRSKRECINFYWLFIISNVIINGHCL